MMSDKEFAELELRATICPRQCSWPKSEYVHWQKLHQAVDEARARLRNVRMQMDDIDSNVELSRDAKYHERSKLATQAIAEFVESKTLVRARQAVELVATEEHVSHEDRNAALKAMKETEAGWQKAVNKIAERAGLTKSGVRYGSKAYVARAGNYFR